MIILLRGSLQEVQILFDFLVVVLIEIVSLSLFLFDFFSFKRSKFSKFAFFAGRMGFFFLHFFIIMPVFTRFHAEGDLFCEIILDFLVEMFPVTDLAIEAGYFFD